MGVALQLLAVASAHATATVLLEVQLAVDGKTVLPAGRGDANQRPRFLLANLDTLEAPRRVYPTALAVPVSGRPWLQLDVAPGSYFLLVLPPGVEQNPPAVAYSVVQARYGRLAEYHFKQGRGGKFSPDLGAFAFAGAVPTDFKALAGFWLEVPRDDVVVHAGSLALDCKGGRGLFGSLIDSCSDFSLIDDAPAARQVAADVFPGRPLMTRMLTPYGSLRAGSAEAGGVAPTPVLQGNPGVAAVPTPRVVAAPPALHGVGRAFALYNLLAVGEGLRLQAAERRRARELEQGLQACLARLSVEAGRLEVDRLFEAALAELPAPGQRSWTVRLALLRLREVGATDQLGLELGLSLRAHDSATGAAQGQLIAVSAPAAPPVGAPHGPASPLYLLQVAEPAALRTREDWCGAAAAATFATEVQAALRSIAGFAATLRTASPTL